MASSLGKECNKLCLKGEVEVDGVKVDGHDANPLRLT